MVECKECGKAFTIISHKHLKKHKMTISQYKEKWKDAPLFSTKYSNNLSKALKGKKTGDSNPAKRKNVKEKIKNSVKKLWDEGIYKDRINGMKGVCKEAHPNWKPEIHEPLFLTKKNYVSYLSQYEDVTSCRRCGSKKAINIHHIDEDHNNFLPSNLEPLCVYCHSNFHYSLHKRPFMTVGKLFSFAACHRLPKYDGPCERWHGHEWGLKVAITKRIDKKTGMVLDFSELKEIVTKYIINILDHNVINEVIENPTAENMLVWIWETLMFDAHLKGIDEITLWETPTSEAILNKKGMLSLLSSRIEENQK
jgi:6-pyruvoyltetrahydropterin/6-carboxytetrahydropterin synthase